MTAPDPTETFRQEAQELLESLEQLLLDLERSPGDTDLIDGAFRALHTIKGSGAMFGFDAVAAFTHHVETAFDLVRKGKVASSRELIAVALAAKDQMRILIERPGAAAKPIGDAILRDLQKIVEAPAAAAAAAAGGTATWRIRFRLPQNVMAMGTNPLLLLDELRGLGAATVTAHTAEIPPLVEIDPTACHIGWDVVLSTEHPRSAIEDVFLFVLDDMELKIEPVQGDGASKRLGEILVERGDVKTEAVEALWRSRSRSASCWSRPARSRTTSSPQPWRSSSISAPKRARPRARRPSACPPSGSTNSWTGSANWSSRSPA